MPTGSTLAGQRVLPLLDEGLGHRGDFGDRAVQPERGVDAVRQQIAGDAAAGDVDVQPPQPFAALRQVARDRPVLQELRAVVKDAAQLAFVDQLLEQDDRRHAAVVVPDHVGDAGALRPPSTIACASAAFRPSGFSHITILPARGRGDGDLGVRVVRAGDVDEVDVLALDERAPVGFGRLVAPVVGERPHAVGVARARPPSAPADTAGRRSAAPGETRCECVRPMNP